jgi:hypothetical protein
MKIRNSILNAGALVLLAAFSGIAIAGSQKTSSPVKQATTESSKKAASIVSRGTISSIDDSRLVMTHKKQNGQTEELTFMLSSSTERKGDLKVGTPVSVHYTNVNNELKATAIQATSEKSASNTKKPAKS